VTTQLAPPAQWSYALLLSVSTHDTEFPANSTYCQPSDAGKDALVEGTKGTHAVPGQGEIQPGPALYLRYAVFNEPV